MVHSSLESARIEASAAACDQARSTPQPALLAPQLATLAEGVPAGDGWLHELKFDGYRLLAFKKGALVRLLTRRGNDWTDKFPTVAAAVAKLPVAQGVFDGEVVVLAADGVSNFQRLQNSLQNGATAGHVYYLFDLPHCEGWDLTSVPLVQRKELLAKVCSAGSDRRIRFSGHHAGNGDQFWGQACQLGLEGVISKRADSGYESRRSRSWLKIKCLARQEFVVVGYTEPAGSRQHFGALLLAVHNDAGQLTYCGRVGTGFSEQALARIMQQLQPLEVTRPTANNPPRGSEARGVHWLKPQLVAEISFAQWTDDNRLRHASFQGLRQDKPVAAIRRERALALG